MPALITLLLVIFSAIDYQIKDLGNFMPIVSIIAIYYWCMFSPSLIPMWFVFLLGLFQDFLYGTPVGMSSLLLLLFLKVVHLQRRYLMREDFIIFWLVFCFLSLLYVLVSGMAYSIYYESMMISEYLFMQWIYTVFLYPFLHLLFAQVQAKLLDFSV